MMPATLHEWFCLNDGRDSFKLKALQDRGTIFCHEHEINDEMLRSIEMRYAANEPVKMLIWGDWGVGKTHAVNHVRWWLEKNAQDYPAKTVLIEIGDIEKKSRFDSIVRPFLDELSLDYLIELTRKYNNEEKNGIEAALQANGVELYVATVFAKLMMATPGMTPPQVVQDAFSILKGRKPPAGGSGMGLGEQLKESRDFFSVLLAIGVMHRVVHGERMLFIADEGAKLEDVEDDAATNAHWVAANRAIFDDNNDVFGFIYTVSAKSARVMPQAIWHPQIQNRLSIHNTFGLENLDSGAVADYLTRISQAIVDKQCVAGLINDGQIDEKEYEEECYPFTKESRVRFLEYWDANLGDAKPRDISDKLNALGFIALKSGKRLIDIACLETANM